MKIMEELILKLKEEIITAAEPVRPYTGRN